MTLITRINRLFRADMHAVLDNLEEPAVLLKQAIREMEEILGAEERQLRALRQERTLIVSIESDAQTQAGRLEDELALCLAAGKDALARAVIRRQLEAAQRRTQRSRRAEAIDRHVIELEARVTEHRQRLQELRLAASSAEATAAQATQGPLATQGSDCDATISDEAVELALLRAKAQRSES